MAAMDKQRKWEIADRDEMRAYSRNVYSDLVTDATKAGFNPLTALRNGGGGNYNAAAGMAPLSRKAPVQQAVAASVPMGAGAAIGDAISNFGNNFMQNFDPHADQKREQEYRLIESQISSLNASALSNTRNATRSYASGDYERRPSGGGAQLSAKSKGAPTGAPTPWETGDVTVTNPWQRFDVNPNISDADAFEQRYGDSEIASTLYGGAIGIGDLWHNAMRGVEVLKKKYGEYSSRKSPPLKSNRKLDLSHDWRRNQY